jgi:ABC-2 type transport system ATP-binding protein
MQAKMREFVRAYNERTGATVLLTSHYMDDVVALCPRVVVIDRGRLIYDGDLKELARRVRPDKRVTIRLAQPAPREALDKLATAVSQISEDGAQVILTVPGERLSGVVRDVLALLPVVDLTVEDPPLEEVMQELFRGQPREARGDAGTPE